MAGKKMARDYSDFRAAREALEKGDYGTAIKRWKMLKTKAEITEEQGREFPGSVIDLGIKTYEKVFEEYLKSEKELYDTLVFLNEYTDLLSLKISKSHDPKIVGELSDRVFKVQEALLGVRERLQNPGKYVKNPGRRVV